MSMSTVNPNDRLIQPDDLPLAILVITCIFWGLSVITVSLRAYTRVLRGTFALDDGFAVAGLIVYTVATGLSIYALMVGLGRRQADLNLWQATESMKYYIIWILVYVVALATVKSSICITILRIASTKMNLRITVYALLAITWASFLITFIGTLTYCQPVKAIWMPMLVLSGQATCAPVSTFIIIGHTATVSTILTDLALVVVPALILWNTQMKKQAKLQAFGLLSFASVASIITMVRIPYVNKFKGMTDLQFWVAHTMLCSNIETGIGCIASSVPSLRSLIRPSDSEGSSGPSKRSVQRPSNFTFGSQPRRGVPEENWERLHDGASDQSEAPITSKERAAAFDFELSSMNNDQKVRR